MEKTKKATEERRRRHGGKGGGITEAYVGLIPFNETAALYDKQGLRHITVKHRYSHVWLTQGV
jgi:hypothetical protein